MNSLSQGFQKLEPKQYRHTDTCDRAHYHAAFTGRKISFSQGLNYFSGTTKDVGV